jgi:hypothetical protein
VKRFCNIQPTKLVNAFYGTNRMKMKLNISTKAQLILYHVRVSIFSILGIKKIQLDKCEFDIKYGFMLKYGLTDSIDYQDVKNYYQSLSPQERAEKGV